MIEHGNQTTQVVMNTEELIRAISLEVARIIVFPTSNDMPSLLVVLLLARYVLHVDAANNKLLSILKHQTTILPQVMEGRIVIPV